MPAPERRCVGCGRPAPKAAMLRFAVRDGSIHLDAAGRAPGRGAYAHPECVEAALRPSGLGRALRATLDGAEAVRLRQDIEKAGT